jgi:dTDP-4-dehydrorhamnose reductase
MDVSIEQTKLYSCYSMNRLNVLILGGSGYLGQFLRAGLSSKPYIVHWKSSKDVNYLVEDPKEFASQLKDLVDISVVINCAAISLPGDCAKDPIKAEKVNVPISLINWMNSLPNKPFFIHFSTDQVYNGSKSSFYLETDETEPVNEYGRTKVKAEHMIKELYPTHHVILRSSIIIGPSQLPFQPLNNRMVFLEFIHKNLTENKPTSYFFDEYRNPISVFDIIQVVHIFIQKQKQFRPMKGETFNLGGPERLSRVDMARIVCDVCKFNKELIQPVSSSSIIRPVKSPSDISMDSTKLMLVCGEQMKFTTFKEVVEKLYQ